MAEKQPYQRAGGGATRRKSTSPGHEKQRMRTLMFRRKVAAARSKGQTLVSDGQKVGRNQTCPCGTGQKFKRCCYE